MFMVFSAQQTGVNFRSLAHVLLCRISVIIGRCRSNAGGGVYRPHSRRQKSESADEMSGGACVDRRGSGVSAALDRWTFYNGVGHTVAAPELRRASRTLESAIAEAGRSACMTIHESWRNA